MPGARCARSLARNKKAHEHSHHGHAGITRAFPAQWFTAYSVLSPVTGFLPLSPADRSTGLAPASGRQDHTALPSASAPFVKSAACVHRIPPHVRDDREPPLISRRDGAKL